jgi:hypothetical protein
VTPTHRSRRPRVVMAGVMAAALCTSATTLAQEAKAHVSVQPTKSFYVPPGTAFGLFAPTDAVEVEVRLDNETSDRQLVVDGGFFQAIKWTLTRADERAVDVEVIWNDTATCAGQGAPTECSLVSRTILGPLNSLQGLMTLQTRAPLAPGDYRLHLDMSTAKGMLREADDSPWRGGLLDRGSVGLTLRAPRSNRDRATVHRIEGGRAAKARDFVSALREYQQMAAEDPSNTDAVAGMADALVELGRFKEAIAVLERPVATGKPESIIWQNLAVAYLATGQDPLAEALVRQRVPPDAQPMALSALRGRANRLLNRR